MIGSPFARQIFFRVGDFCSDEIKFQSLRVLTRLRLNQVRSFLIGFNGSSPELV